MTNLWLNVFSIKLTTRERNFRSLVSNSRSKALNVTGSRSKMYLVKLKQLFHSSDTKFIKRTNPLSRLHQLNLLKPGVSIELSRKNEEGKIKYNLNKSRQTIDV